MDDDTILIEEYEELTLPSERKREHAANIMFKESKLIPFRDALVDYNTKRENSPRKGTGSITEDDQLFTELNNLIDINPKKMDCETEGAETSRGLNKSCDDNPPDSASRIKIKREDSSSNANELDSGNDSDSYRYFPSIQGRYKKSNHWKNAKKALGALQFTKQVSQQEEEKQNNIMQGSKNHVKAGGKSRTIFLLRDSSILYFWNTLIFLTIIYYNIIVPYVFAFKKSTYDLGLTEIMLDLIILFDIVFKLITFPSMRKHSNFKEDILKPYVRKFLAIDILCILPLYFVDSRFLVIKFLRNFHLSRCFHSIRKLSFKLKLAGTNGYAVLHAAKIWLILLLAVHLLSCVWIYIGLENHPSWIDAYKNAYPEIFNNDHIDYYINAYFFLITTASTVGFGGEYFVANNKLEMIICMLIILAGLVVAGFFQGKIVYMLQNSIESKSIAAEINDELERWILMRENLMMMNERIVDNKGHELMNKILNYFKFYNSNNVKYNTSASEFFERIAPDTKDRVIDKSLHGIIATFRIFFTHIKDLSFQKEVILYLKPKSFMPFQKIISRGHHPAGIYFLLQGYVVVYTKGGEAIVLLSNGSYFGDSFLAEKKARYDICSGHEEVKCLFISRRKFLDICSRYPATTINFAEIAKTRINFERESFRSMVETLKGNLRGLLKPFNDIPSLVDIQEIPSSNNYIDSITKVNKESCNYFSVVDSGKHEFPYHRSRKFLSYVRNTPSTGKKIRISEIVELQEKVEKEFKKPAITRNNLAPETIVDLQKLKFYSEKLDGSDYSYSETEDEEDVSVGDDNDDASEKSFSDDGDDDEKLNNSLETPFMQFELENEDSEYLENNLRYLDERIHSLHSRIDRIKKNIRHESMNFWKSLKHKKKKITGQKESDVSMNTHESFQ